MPASEEERVSVYRQLHDTELWPPKRFGDYEIATNQKWEKVMNQKEETILKIKEIGWRWERWLEQVQIRTLPAFTHSGWKVVKMDESVHDKVSKVFTKEHVCEKDVDAFMKRVKPGVVEENSDMADTEVMVLLKKLWDAEKAKGLTEKRTIDCPSNFVNKEGSPGYIKGSVYVSKSTVSKIEQRPPAGVLAPL
jgi:hypothetical protein